MITDPTAINLFYVNLVGVGVRKIDDKKTIPVVHVKLDRE
jgi:hypothetical protein